MTMTLGLLLIVTSVGWAAQWALTDYWCKRCRDLEATQRQRRHIASSAPDPVVVPIPTFNDSGPVQLVIPADRSVVPQTFRVPSLNIPPLVSTAWKSPRPFPPASLIPCPRR